MLSRSTILAAGFLAFLAVPAWGDGALPPKPTVTPVITTGETILGQPIAYPAGAAEISASIITIPPGGETGWHLHAVPLFGYILEGALTVDYGAKGTRTYTAGSGLVEAMNWPHNGTNKGSVPVRLLAVYAGASGIANSEAVAP